MPPLTAKGRKIEAALVKEYGEARGKKILYAGQNKGTFTGIDELAKAREAGEREREAQLQAERLLRGESVSGRDRAKLKGRR